ncbi:hypothetical protein F4803DRAFT_576861 [Xylaria telfairii]|nr:hypothetical protein F4803DRAFT_576861 [Xylaria telfairii]
MQKILDEGCVSKIKRIAIEIRGPRARGSRLYAPSYTKLFGGAYVRRLAPISPLAFTRRLLASATTIFLVLSFKAARKIYKRRVAEQITENDEQDNTDDDELEMKSDSDTEEESDAEEDDDDEICFYPHDSDSDTSSVDIGAYDPYQDDDDEYYDWIISLPKDEFDFHHIEAESNSYFETPLTYISQRRATLKRMPMYFNDWVRKMISRTEDDARGNFCGRPVDIHMVMDCFGGYDIDIQSYYIGHAGFHLIDECIPGVPCEES